MVSMDAERLSYSSYPCCYWIDKHGMSFLNMSQCVFRDP
jgi:hypothetical protein